MIFLLLGANLEGNHLICHLLDLLMSHIVCLLQNPAIADIYTEHAHPVTVAKYSPSGYYIASGGKRLAYEHVNK